MAVYECELCGYRYDETRNDRPWSELPEDWLCPICRSRRERFVRLPTPGRMAAPAPDAAGRRERLPW